MSYLKKDRSVLRELGEKVSEIEALPINEQRKELYRKIGNSEKTKPIVHWP
jgi:hypothetical protein